jgi:hypothetical protein
MTYTLAAGDDFPPDRTGQPISPVIRADSPTALLRIIPHLLGFAPEASLVVIGVSPPRDRIQLTLRYDLPDPPEAGLIADVVAHAVAIVRKQQLTGLVAVGYGPEALVTPVTLMLRDASREAGIGLREFLRVHDGRYWSYTCGDEDCCPAAGTPFEAGADSVDSASYDSASYDSAGSDPAGSDPTAAALAAIGPALASRAAVAARVAPLGGLTAESMRQATRRAERHVSRLLSRVRSSSRLGAARQMIAVEGLAAVGGMITRYRDGGRFTSDDEVARVTVALRDLRIRDDAWARMDPAHAEAHLLLWTDVVRRAQPGHVAAPAALLAFVAWQSGDGALANVALDRALDDVPDYSMALLLRQVIAAGAPPSLARLPMTPEEVAASYQGAEPHADGPGCDLDDHESGLENEG